MGNTIKALPFFIGSEDSPLPERGSGVVSAKSVDKTTVISYFDCKEKPVENW